MSRNCTITSATISFDLYVKDKAFHLVNKKLLDISVFSFCSSLLLFQSWCKELVIYVNQLET